MKKSWRIVVIRQIRQSFFPSKVFYCTVELSYGETMNHLPSSSAKQSHIFLSVVGHFVSM